MSNIYKFTKNAKKSEVVAMITADPKEWAVQRGKAYNAIKQNLVLKGFRKGKVPDAIAKREIDNNQIWNKAIKKILNTLASEAITKMPKTIRVLSGPSYSIEKISNHELVLKFTYPIKPEIKLCSYDDVKIPYVEVKTADSDVKSELEKLQQQLAMSKKVNGPCKNGHEIVIDFTSTMDGKPFEGGSAKDFKFVLGQGKLIKDLETGILGMKVNETKKIPVVFPKNYNMKSLSNKKAIFTVTLNAASSITLPAIDDDLAKEAGLKKIKNLVELKKHFKKQLQEKNERNARNIFDRQVIDKFVENCEIKVHDILISQEIDQNEKEFNQTLKKQNITIDQYLNYSGASKETLYKQFAEDANNKLKASFVLGAIIKREKMVVTKKDQEDHYREVAKIYSLKVEQIKQFIKPEQTTQQILNKKVLDFLFVKCRVNAPKKVATKKTVVKKAIAKKPVAKKIITKKPVAKKSTTKKKVVKKTPAKKVVSKK